MAEKPRIRLPKQAGKGDVVEIKTLLAHVMESGQRKDARGKLVPRKIINHFTCSFNGKPVFDASWSPPSPQIPTFNFPSRSRKAASSRSHGPMTTAP